MGNPGEIPGNDLLVKTVERINQDSLVTLYYYDTARRWVGSTSRVNTNVSALDDQVIIVRDADGIITKTIYKSGFINDSFYFKVNYNRTLSRYESKSSNRRLTTPFYRDSMQFQYDNAQKIAGYLYYILDYRSLFDVMLTAKVIFSRDGQGNIISEKVYQFENGNLHDSVTFIYKYDNKVRPLQLSDGEALVTEQDGRYAVNNNIYTNLIGSNGLSSHHVEKKFVYNSLNKPVSSVSTLLHDNNKKIFLEFYYQ